MMWLISELTYSLKELQPYRSSGVSLIFLLFSPYHLDFTEDFSFYGGRMKGIFIPTEFL